MTKNAIILAAGKSNRFAPFTYEKPKGLFCVKGEVLIERQIDQLIEAGVSEIILVVGYMKEKFFYLEQKYKEVKLIVNNSFSNKGNIYSLYVALSHLDNTFVCCADHYFVNNPFIDGNDNNNSYRASVYLDSKFREFAISKSDVEIITSMSVGGRNSFAMVGHAYFNSKFSAIFKKLLAEEINDFGIASMFWEEFYAKHMSQLTMYAKEFNASEILEFDSIDDLRNFDTDFLLNVDSDIISNIVSILNCNPNDISDIKIINAGLTNVSFGFMVDSETYIYRHPGGTAGNLVDRHAEIYAQLKAKERGIDESVIWIDPRGWKLSYYVKDAKNCDFEEYDDQLVVAMEYLHKLHKVNDTLTLVDGSRIEYKDVKIFDDVLEGKKLMAIASERKGNLFKEFGTEVAKVEALYEAIKQDAKRLNYGLVLCHNDVYAPNYLYDDLGKIFLIDWEYAGLNYEANDICCILCRYDFTDEQVAKYLY